MPIPSLAPGEAIVVPVLLEQKINAFLSSTGTSFREAEELWHEWYQEADLSLLATFYEGAAPDGTDRLRLPPGRPYRELQAPFLPGQPGR